MANRHDVNLACECGATLKLSSGTGGFKEGRIIMVWNETHSGLGHGPCELHEARDIRRGAKLRQRDWKKEYARRQELKALTSR